MAMRVAPYLGWVGITALGLTWPGAASAAGETVSQDATVLIALILGLGVTVFGCIIFRRRALAAEETVKKLEAEKAFHSAVAALGEEQAIIWPYTEDGETASDGLAALLGVPADTANWLEALRSTLSEADSDALEKAVDGLRHQRREFDLTVRTPDGGRIFSLRGDCVVAGAMGAAVLLIGERTADIKQIDRLQSESQALHRVLDALPVPVWVRDNTLGLKYANQAYREAVEADGGIRDEDLPELVASGRPTDSGQALARRAQTEKSAQSEQRHIVVDGARRWVEVVETPFGNSDELAGFAIDITNVEEVQTELSRHIAGHEVILQNLGTAIALYGPDQRLQFFNNAFLQLWGLDEAWLRTSPPMGEVLEGLRESRRLPEHANFPSFKQEQLALFTTLMDPLEETLHLPDDKTLRWVAIPHPFGGLLMLWEDVTDAVALERNYYTLIAVQRETLDNLYEGVAVIGANGRLKLSNPAFGSMWEIPAQELDNEPHISEIVDRMAELLHPVDDWMEEKERLIGTLTAREPNTGRIERSDNSVLDFATVPLPDGAVLLSYLDVTAAINMERALRERNEALETADRLKSEFIANVSYELRTPLNTIIGFTEILAGQYFGDLNDRQTEYAAGILESSNRLLLLIDDILDLATIEAGHMSLELDSIDLNTVLTSVLGLVRERARQKSIDLACECPDDIGSIVADERRLKQALFNILSNAVKFTPDNGEIVLSAKRDNGEIILTTRDSGIGISAEDQERVFGKFERGSNPEARRSGAGLGLSLVKSFVELHGGSVVLESAADEGTKVICTLPARASGPGLPH
jgi:signal transduction histidine kinase